MPPDLLWWAPQVGANEQALIAEVLRSNYLNDGKVTEDFEHRVAELLGCRHAVAVTSGTAAIFLALAGLGVGPGDEVIVPDITFIATANAVTLTGARPVLADVNPQTLTLSPEAAAQVITRRTRAIVPVHISGRSADMPALLELARCAGLFVVEDAAEGLLSRYGDRYLGTLGDAGALSFSPNKTITTGQGGMVLTDDAVLHRRLRELKDQGRAVQGTGGDDLHPCVGYNFKLTNLQAAVGLGQMEQLGGRIERLKQIYEGYSQGLAGVPGVSLPGFRTDRGESPQWVDVLADERDTLHDHLLARGMHCRRFWFPLHTQAPYRQPDAEFPHSTRVIPHAMWLPSAFTMSDQDVERVCAAIREFMTGQGRPRLAAPRQNAA
jgi:perosamine synthetase